MFLYSYEDKRGILRNYKWTFLVQSLVIYQLCYLYFINIGKDFICKEAELRDLSILNAFIYFYYIFYVS